MELFKWDTHFQTGIASIDQQHHRLVDIINEFSSALTDREKTTKAEMQHFFNLLLDYAHEHFCDEEALMQVANIDSRHFQRHQLQHQAYLKEITREQEKFTSDPEAATKLLAFLGQWLIYHILGSDQSMAHQIDAIHAGTTPALAWKQERESHNKSTEPLLHALNALVEQVMERNSQLHQINETLEARVAERTHELALANEQLRQMAQTDVLTGLPNRRHAMERLEQFWSEAQRHDLPFACVMLDVDGFKQINDTYGHDAGDTVLHELAHALQRHTRKEDVVCRLGGDEFLILCPKTDLAGVRLLAEKLLEQINLLEIPAGAGLWRGSLSMGIAARAPIHNRANELINAADLGLYAAKRNGKNRVAFAGD